MEVAFEYIFYAGLIALAVGLFWLLLRLVKGPRKKIWVPLLVMVFGAGLMATPAAISRNLPVDLGARETIVDGERVLGLTGWNGKSYAFLAQKSDAVVLQMANADVTDETLKLISGMEKLRELDLNDSRVTDSGLKSLAGLTSLQRLYLRGTKITDAGFREHLMPLANLQRINLEQTAISDAVIAEWKAAGKRRRALK
jgi:hypothetical protein